MKITRLPLRWEQVLLILRGDLVDIMCQVSQEYKKYVVHVNGKKVLYLRVLRALYGCLESAMLWYKLYSETLQKMGFILNPYDGCVANKVINGKQCTIAFYVDDNKISHEDPEVVTQVIKELSTYFGELKVQRGTKFDILGMTMEFKNKKVYISMVEYLKDAIKTYEECFGALSNGKSSTPGKGDIFTSREEDVELDEVQSKTFHTVTAKLLHVCKRARLDIDPVVAYLCTRVSCSTENDRDKLERLLRYIKRTMNDVRTYYWGKRFKGLS